jgi:lysophospholipase L1-like esterase
MKIRLTIVAALFLLTSFRPPAITWTAIGDSITYLNDHQDETGNRISKGYMSMVAERLPNVSFVNQGHNGWTAVGIAREIENLGLKKTDVYSIFLGTNDWWQGLPVGKLDDYVNNTGLNTVYGAFKIIINKIHGLNPNAKIILITPMQRGDFVYINDAHNNAWGSYKAKNEQLLLQFATAVKKIAEHEHYQVIDLYNEQRLKLEHLVNFKRLKDPKTGVYKNYKYPDYTGVPFNPDTDEYPYPVEAMNYTYDGLHPSDKGYQVIADLLIKGAFNSLAH